MRVEEQGEATVRSIIKGVYKDWKEETLVVRAVRGTGDLDLIGTLRWSRGAIDSFCKTPHGPVMTDTRMAYSGLGEIGVYLEPKVRKSEYISQDLILSNKGALQGKVVLIGTSPLALEALIDLHREENVTPLLVVAVPVGFVNALRAKAKLMSTDMEYITNLSTKGGVGLGVSIVHALRDICTGNLR